MSSRYAMQCENNKKRYLTVELQNGKTAERNAKVRCEHPTPCLSTDRASLELRAHKPNFPFFQKPRMHL
jgi:hypothetical protein